MAIGIGRGMRVIIARVITAGPYACIAATIIGLRRAATIIIDLHITQFATPATTAKITLFWRISAFLTDIR